MCAGVSGPSLHGAATVDETVTAAAEGCKAGAEQTLDLGVMF